VTGSLADQPFDILHEYASGLHVSECPSRFASARFRDEPSGIMQAHRTLKKSANTKKVEAQAKVKIKRV